MRAGKSGLLNITEYVEVSMNDVCSSVWRNHGSSTMAPCRELNYLYKPCNQWSISAYSTTVSHIWIFGSSGLFHNYAANATSVGVRPVFYLKSSINLSGTGITDDEYTIE